MRTVMGDKPGWSRRAIRGCAWLAAWLVLSHAGIVLAQSSDDSPVGAPPEGGQIVLLDIRGPSQTSKLREQLDRVLRDTVSGVEDYALVNNAGTTISDMMVVVGCNTVDASCLTQATEQFGARFLLFGDITGPSGERKLSVRMFDAVQGSYLRSFAEPLAELEPPFDGFRRQVESLLKPSADAETLLYVSASVPNAAVRIDGREVGATPLRRRGIAPGEYQIVVDHPDYQQWTTVIELVEGGDIRLRAPLKPLEVVETPPPAGEDEATSNTGDQQAASSSESPGADESAVGERSRPSAPPPAKQPAKRSGVMSWGPWVTMGVGAAGLLGGGLVAVQMQQIESDLEEWRRNNPNNEPGCQGRECTLLDRGRRAETTHRVFLGVGGVAMTSGLLWLLLRPKPDGNASDQHAVKFELIPQPRGVGIGASW